jgi:hypothetical protein
MKKLILSLAPALLAVGMLLGLGACESTGTTDVYVGVGVGPYHPWGYGPGWGGGWGPGYYPPRPIGPVRPPFRPRPTPY